MLENSKNERLQERESFNSKKPYKMGFFSIFTIIFLIGLCFLSINNGKTKEKVITPKIPLRATREESGHVKDEIDINFNIEDHYKMCREFGAEGIVLVKNTGLPLKPTDKVVLYGGATFDTAYGGLGSGEVWGTRSTWISEGIENKAKEEKLTYEWNVKFTVDNDLTEEDVKKQSDKSNGALRSVAIMTIKKVAGEGMDRHFDGSNEGIYLSDAEKETFKLLEKYFDQVVIVLNVCSFVEIMDFVESDKTSIVIAFFPGRDVGNSIADVLVGDMNPCGKLPHTWAKRIEDYSTTATMLENDDYVKYKEGIFIGYRFFEDSKEYQNTVLYPFGYGLSYTTFEISSKCDFENGVFTIYSTVKNTGEMKGKQVVQVYAEKPQNEDLIKAKRELVAFAKTKTLKPGESQELIMKVDLDYLSSYDSHGVTGNKACWVLEKGDYNLYVGENVAETRDSKTKVFTYNLKELKVVEKVTNKIVPEDPDVENANRKPDFNSIMKSTKNRILSEIELEKTKKYEKKTRQSEPLKMPEIETSKPRKLTQMSAPADINFKTVYEGKNTAEELCRSMDLEALAFLPYGHWSHICGATGYIGGNYYGATEKYLIPPGETSDGPAGIRHCQYDKLNSTAWPSVTTLAATFNTEILEQIGIATGQEARALGIDFWLAPGMNIHRNPLCGRNFEYYSEDPFLSGKMAAAITRGLQKAKVSVTLKHYAMYNKETGRYGTDSRVAERTAREIYLRGFQIAVKEADPWAIMTSYNKVNGVPASGNPELINGILRGEWGYHGLVMTDWAAGSSLTQQIEAGSTASMWSGGGYAGVHDGLRLGAISREQLEDVVCKVVIETLVKTAAIEKVYQEMKVIDISSKTHIKLADYRLGFSGELAVNKCSDEDGGDYSWNQETDSYFMLVFQNDNDKERNVRFRYASKFEGFSLQFFVGEEQIGNTIDLPVTGEGDTWKTSSDIKIKFPSGKYEIKLLINNTGKERSAGVLNWFEIE